MREGVSPARRCAYNVLRRVSVAGAYADRAFRAEADAAGLDARERAFAQQLAYGAIQRRATLDECLERLARRPVAALDPPLVDALRLGLLQVTFLDGVADHAAVDQTVELAKPTGGHRLANAVMRRATREARALVESLSDDTPEAAAVAHSHPRWLVEKWWHELGPQEAGALLRRDNEPPESAVRANELVTEAGALAAALAACGVPSRPAPDLPEGLVLEAPFDVHGSDLFAAGALMPQARASMLVARVLDPQPGERVLDLCAAPGAKTTHLAALMGGRGEITAVERHPGRARALRANCRRMGAGSVTVLEADALDAPPGPFQRVLLDPPCSDLGTLQARPDVRWRKEPRQIERLAAAQAALIGAAADRLAPGGTLVYSTCTISAPENEAVLGAFLARRTDLSADDLGCRWPSYAHAGDGRYLRLLPHRHGTDGFFIARLHRSDR